MQSVNLGEIPNEKGIRDALHIAVISLPAGEFLEPGDWVRIYNGMVVGCDKDESIGVVDPFRRYVSKNELVWVCLNPNTVTSVHHYWEHPEFSEDKLVPKPAPTKEESEAWLREYLGRADCPGYDIVIAAATGEHVPSADSEYYSDGYEINDEYLYFGGRDAHGSIPYEMWDHIENVTGKKCIWRPKYFSCSC
jgi:hypothetical protein